VLEGEVLEGEVLEVALASAKPDYIGECSLAQASVHSRPESLRAACCNNRYTQPH